MNNCYNVAGYIINFKEGFIMKHRSILKVSSIFALIMVLLLSTAQFAFAATTGSWETKASMSTPRSDFQTAVVNGKIYAIGGRDVNKNVLAMVEEYDPFLNIWTTKASMPTPRRSFNTEVVNGKIYVIGGIDSNGLSSSVEEYDPILNTWTQKAKLPFLRQLFQTQVISNKIYFIGGGTTGIANSYSDICEYDPALNTWTIKASMNFRRDSFQTAVINGKIYAIGGICYNNGNGNTLGSLEVYDPLLNTWQLKSSMNIARTDFTAQVLDGKIYVFGGYNENKYLSSVEKYDPETDKWTVVNPMSSSRVVVNTEVTGNEIYVIGGFDGTNNLATVEAYDTTTDSWEAKASTTNPPCKTDMINGDIYAIGGYCGNEYTSLVEEYILAKPDPTLTITTSSNKVKVGQQFTTSVDIHNVTNICAEDIKITYNKDLFTYVGAEAQDGLKIYKEDTSVPGTVRFICACQGKENAATGDKGLITLKFTAKKEGTGKVDIVKGRIADNATLEMDVAEANCGEDTITVEGYADVNRNGEFTLLDLGIDGWYNGMNAADTDTAKFNADIIADGKIDDNDLAEITKGILSNSNYTFNTSLS
jgi:N-acetylneuraminic acid mutarotase